MQYVSLTFCTLSCPDVPDTAKPASLDYVGKLLKSRKAKLVCGDFRQLENSESKISTSNMLSVFLCFTVLVTVNCELLLTTNPETVLPGVTTKMDIRCSLGPNSQEVSRVMVMQLEKVNGIHIRPLASMTTGEDAKLDTQFPPNKATVTGLLTSDPKACFIQLTLANPDAEDAGEYLCVMSVLDRSYLLERFDVRGNVNATNPDDIEATTLVIQELKTLQRQIKEISERCQSSCTGSSGSASSSGDTAPFVAFTAYPAARRDFHRGTLLFDSDLVNVGGAYDPSRSIFTAPVNGTYVFTAAISTDDFKTITELKHNGDTVAQLATVSDDQASNSVVLELEGGDRVWLEGVYQSSNVTLYADKDTIFSGYLLHAS
ncbi:hypothetical protein BaRGS_00022929 [Batillaria attramentaria]|uniref:C1q domain-containing protein n=1 Tax=Batillaria attramentaria TaxID=370345 RepID=A0ABD0KFJ9_9CAEN